MRAAWDAAPLRALDMAGGVEAPCYHLLYCKSLSSPVTFLTLCLQLLGLFSVCHSARRPTT
jgi:hypothetical protein